MAFVELVPRERMQTLYTSYEVVCRTKERIITRSAVNLLMSSGSDGDESKKQAVLFNFQDRLELTGNLAVNWKKFN
jgi:hypothetical protein